MGRIHDMKEKGKEAAKEAAKKKAKQMVLKAVMRLLSAAMPYILPILIAGVATVIALGIIDWVVETFTAENNPKLLYETLKIEDVAELITIKGNETDGYYLDFVDGVDEKLEKIIKKYNKSPKYHNLPKDVGFLKKMLKAEVVTQFPDLKGTIPDDAEDGFQGAIKVRRVTPNKKPRRNEKYRTRRNIISGTRRS